MDTSGIEAAASASGCGHAGVWLGVLALSLALVGLGLRALLRRGERSAQAEREAWIVARLASQLQARLGGRPTVELEEVLAGRAPASPELRAAFALQVRHVALRATRGPANVVEVVEELRLADGGHVAARTSVPWDRLPGEIRAHFLRHGGAAVELPWHAPWNDPGVPPPTGETSTATGRGA